MVGSAAIIYSKHVWRKEIMYVWIRWTCLTRTFKQTFIISSILRDSGESIKSCVSHTLTYDTRDDVLLPTTGIFLRLRNELAGLVGDTQHFKTESELQHSTSLPLGLVIHGQHQITFSLQYCPYEMG